MNVLPEVGEQVRKGGRVFSVVKIVTESALVVSFVWASTRILEADTVVVLDDRDVAPLALDKVDDLFEMEGECTSGLYLGVSVSSGVGLQPLSPHL